MKSPIPEKINGNVLKTVILIVMVFFYLAMIIHGIETKHPFLKTLTDVAQIMGGLAGLIASYAALVGVYSWRNQIKATVKYNKLVNFRQTISQCNNLFTSTFEMSNLLLTMRKCGTDISQYETTFELLEKRKNDFTLLTKEIHEEARVIDLLFFGEHKYLEAMRLSALTHHISKHIQRYFNLTIHNRDINAIEVCRDKTFEHFKLINSQINAYENNI